MARRQALRKETPKFFATNDACRTNPRNNSRFDGGRLSSALTGTKFAFFSVMSSHFSLQDRLCYAKKTVRVPTAAGAPYRKSTQPENSESVRKNHTYRATSLFCSRIDAHHVPPQPHRLNAIPARRLHRDLQLRLQPRQVFQRNQRALQGNISHNGFFLEILPAFRHSADFRVELRFTPQVRARSRPISRRPARCPSRTPRSPRASRFESPGSPADDSATAP